MSIDIRRWIRQRSPCLVVLQVLTPSSGAWGPISRLFSPLSHDAHEGSAPCPSPIQKLPRNRKAGRGRNPAGTYLTELSRSTAICLLCHLSAQPGPRTWLRAQRSSMLMSKRVVLRCPAKPFPSASKKSVSADQGLEKADVSLHTKAPRSSRREQNVSLGATETMS